MRTREEAEIIGVICSDCCHFMFDMTGRTFHSRCSMGYFDFYESPDGVLTGMVHTTPMPCDERDFVPKRLHAKRNIRTTDCRVFGS